jgi:glucose-6-phosphate 1-dehydrogenase
MLDILNPEPTAIVIFGATGDLTHRKLLPALFNLAVDGYLPSSFVVIGASRTELSDQEFRDKALESVRDHSRRPVDDETWYKFANNLFYQSTDGASLQDFIELKARLTSLQSERKCEYHFLYYLAMAPRFFAEIAKNLAGAGLVEDVHHSHKTRLVVEKPFGTDLESARILNTKLRESFAEEQIFRIDHYLGKEIVQNILVFRFANGIFEPLWNRKYIDHIQISVCETVGAGHRAGYFDQSGIVRDIVQNHVMQMLSLLCIEPPNSLTDANSIRNEKVKVLEAISRYKVHEVEQHTVRARYTRGRLGGDEVPGYLEAEGVAPKSTTDTYIAMRLGIDNWRWAGVPIYVRAGKRLPKRITEITIYFTQPPQALFGGKKMSQNVLAIQVQPQEGISLRIGLKPPGPQMAVSQVEMDFTYHTTFEKPSPDAYERLLLDAMRGDATLFTRDDEIEQAWDFLTPVFNSWSGKEAPPVYEYEAGTWGPVEAQEMLIRDGRIWRKF